MFLPFLLKYLEQNHFVLIFREELQNDENADVEGGENNEAGPEGVGARAYAQSEQISGTRLFCGALLLPTFSTIIGRIFFDSVQNNVHKTILGGLSFIVIKGVLKIYFKQNQMVQKKARRIMDHNAENLRRFSRGTPRPRNYAPRVNDNLF